MPNVERIPNDEHGGCCRRGYNSALHHSTLIRHSTFDIRHSSKVLVFVAAVFALHVCLRVLVSDTSELDESEQVLLAQELRWGYGAQPPLYTWLQYFFFWLLGTNIFALSLLKHLLLFGTYCFTYLAARQITGNATVSALAMLSLFLIPQFAWESHRDLTHSVAATCLGTATLWRACILFERRRPVDYVVLGLLAGLGVLAKYNFGIFFGAFLGAAISRADFRNSILSPWLVLSLVTFAVITYPHFHWLTSNANVLASARGGFKLSGVEWADRTENMLRFAKALVSFAAVAVPVYAYLRWKLSGVGVQALACPPFESPSDGLKPALQHYRTLIGRTLVIAGIIGLLVVTGFDVRFKDRWFQPIFFSLPLWLVLWVSPKLTAQSVRAMSILTTVIALGVVVIMYSIPVAASITKRPTRLNSPYSELAAKLKQSGINPAAIVADNRLLGGNLRLQFPETFVVVPELPFQKQHIAQPALIAWDATKRTERPAALSQLLKKLGVQELPPPQYLESPLKYMREKNFRLGYILAQGQRM